MLPADWEQLLESCNDATGHVVLFSADFISRWKDRTVVFVQGLEGLAYAHLAQSFWRLAKDLATESDPLPLCALQLGNRTSSRRSYRAICDIPLDISKEELDHRLRVFGGSDWGMSPAINLHGIEFRAVTANSPSPAI